MSYDNPKAKIDALLKIVNAAVHQAVTEYEKSGDGIPTLDTPYAGDSKYPTPTLRKAIRLLEGACDQLCSTLANPAHTVFNRAISTVESGCFRVAVEAGIADILVHHPKGLHIDKLAEKTGIQGAKLARILRLLATKHCFREISPDVFANNRLSFTLTHSQGTGRSFGNLVSIVTVEGIKGPAVLYETLTEPGYSTSYSSSKAPFMYACKSDGIDGSLFDWFKVHPERGDKFSSSMLEFSELNKSNAVVENFPWKDLPAGTTVCDVAGGVGSLSLDLARTHPHLSITLQDLPETTARAEKLWNAVYPEAVKEGKINFVSFDFFKEHPVEGLDIYFLRYIIHDWSDEQALPILHGLRQAMRKHSRLFIQDIVLQPLNRESIRDNQEFFQISIETAPEPLLPNYGAGIIQDRNRDLSMFCLMNSKERTLGEVLTLTSAAGLKLVKMWDVAQDAILEFSTVED